LSGTRLEPAGGAAASITGVVGAITPGFVVIAHDPDETIFGAAHAEALYAAAGEPRELWWVPGGGHGRTMLTDEFIERVGAAIRTRVATAPAPPGPPSPPPPAPPAGR
jgi:fermentation-respiration switch protein FrsA (DUF1100 family)